MAVFGFRKELFFHIKIYMIILEFIGAIIRFCYLRIIKQEKVLFTDIWKTFDFKSRDAFGNNMTNSEIGIAFTILVIVIIILFFD
ncbi:hypothetical protein ATO12_05215 [Aquimarina atlantica]|uniref:Uncharacterized protein n=1 Tax=Aquimarina atlantica TaxID=1317122 RepID=A0A023BPK9_9FLAO|nr:hypothetical protein [Aquimarina atlantica]EZH72015.1 hypothetical protein ATO12_05215 [Aquimarina atlantica]